MFLFFCGDSAWPGGKGGIHVTEMPYTFKTSMKSKKVSISGYDPGLEKS